MNEEQRPSHYQSPLMPDKHPDGSYKSPPASNPEEAYDQGFKVGFWVCFGLMLFSDVVAWMVYLNFTPSR